MVLWNKAEQHSFWAQSHVLCRGFQLPGSQHWDSGPPLGTSHPLPKCYFFHVSQMLGYCGLCTKKLRLYTPGSMHPLLLVADKVSPIIYLVLS